MMMTRGSFRKQRQGGRACNCNCPRVSNPRTWCPSPARERPKATWDGPSSVATPDLRRMRLKRSGARTGKEMGGCDKCTDHCTTEDEVQQRVAKTDNLAEAKLRWKRAEPPVNQSNAASRQELHAEGQNNQQGCLLFFLLANEIVPACGAQVFHELWGQKLAGQVLGRHGVHRLHVWLSSGKALLDFPWPIVLEDGGPARQDEVHAVLEAESNVLHILDLARHAHANVATRQCEELVHQEHGLFSGLDELWLCLFQCLADVPARNVQKVDGLVQQETRDLKNIRDLHTKTLSRKPHPDDEVRLSGLANSLDDFQQQAHPTSPPLL
mmetsp:Transcript_5132/g.12243  ORF Transcript_5132/g.12243 Transcript_5132/m.12243 type:complete len:325 (+) Transcript_5132:181-1155(+)